MRKLYGGVCLAMRRQRWLTRAMLTLLATLLVFSQCFAEDITLRLRVAWSNGDRAKHRWTGQISCAGAKLTELQPLGMEADAPIAIQLRDNQIKIDPWEKRGFDGCDITIAGESESLLRFEMQSEQASEPTVVEVPLSKLAKEQLREPIDSLGSYLLAYRCPGDRFRVLPSRENLIFAPKENWPLRLQTDFTEELAVGPVIFDAVVRAIGSEAIVWQSSQTLMTGSPANGQLALDVVSPGAEGAYRLSLSARHEDGFATRFVPGQGSKPFATREIDFVVIDPNQKVPTLGDHWLTVLSIDPANPSWWQRFPTWAQVSRLTGKPPGAIGNVRLLPREGDTHGLVELPPSTNPQEPSWQAFTLPVLEVGVPHLVEITYPISEKQHLGVSLIEPDAAGRVTAPVLDSGLHVDDVISTDSSQTATHRVIFWPRTGSPQLLIVNRHATQRGVFGKITLSRHDDAASASVTKTPSTSDGRMVAGYIAKPQFAQNMGAAEVIDPASGISVQSWSTFLDGARRLTQHLKLSGYNSLMLSVAADGSAIYPSSMLQPSPRFDTGLLAACGQDPVRKDVLEMLLRVCDREEVRVLPAIQLTAPLPRLTVTNDAGGKANYNLLDVRVQHELEAVVMEVARRYSRHASFTGIALQLDSRGYGMLGPLDVAMNDKVLAAFSADTGIELPQETVAAALAGGHRQAWIEWRVEQVTQFYAKLAKQLRAQRPDMKLVLTTENLFADQALAQVARRYVTNPSRNSEALAERGIDLAKLAAIEGLEITNTSRLSSRNHVQEQVADLVLHDVTAGGNSLSHEMVFHPSRQTRLASFDDRSPYTKDRTFLILAEQSMPTSSLNQKPILRSLVNGELGTIVEGGEYLPMVIDSEHRDYLQSLAELPSQGTESRTMRKQPLVMQLRRAENETFLLCVNESPWPVLGTLELDAPAETAWQELGRRDEASTETAKFSGKLTTGRSNWPLALAPYGLHVWRFDNASVRAGEAKVSSDAVAREYLQRRIQDIENRTGNLNIARDYPQLQNPGFELDDTASRIFGWQPRKGEKGSVELETTAMRSGARSVRLKSEDAVGVAVQSHLFPLPETGMLVVNAQVRAEEISGDARLAIAIETEDNGQTYRRVQTFDAPALENQWKPLEMLVSDLPVGDANQIRVQFHIVGQANVLIDDVALCDLRFDDSRRSELVKRVFAAKTALEDDQVVDCLRLLNEYWSRYLVEYVPPLERVPSAIAKQPEAQETDESKTKPGGRLRGWVPKIWR